MRKILTLAGSNSKKSVNKELAVYVASQIPNAEIVPVDLSAFDLPIYGVDLQEEKGIPENAYKINDIIKHVDGIVLSLAEHNGLPTVAYKNLLDWLSRIDKSVWKDKPMLLMATSPGGRGGANVLKVVKEVIPFVGGNVVGAFSLPSFYDNFSEEGIKDPQKKLELQELINKLDVALK